MLRRWRAEDRKAFERIWADRDVWRALRPGVPFDLGYGGSRFERHLDHWEQHGFGLWAAVERSSGEIAGWIGLAYSDFAPELAAKVEVGWTLRRAFWGRGLAGEGAAATVSAGFSELGIDELISLIHPANAPSIGVAMGLGMRQRDEVSDPERGLSLRVYALRSEWV